MNEHMEEVRLVTDVERLTPSQTVQLVPALRREYVASAFLEHGAMDLDTAGLHQGYISAAKLLGVEFMSNAEVLQASFKDHIWSVQTKCGEVKAANLVNAAGAWADVIAERCGVKGIGLVPKIRTCITFEDSGPLALKPSDEGVARWPLVMHQAVQCGAKNSEELEDELAVVPWYFCARSSGFFASLADETPSPPGDVQADIEDVAIASIALRLQRTSRSEDRCRLGLVCAALSTMARWHLVRPLATQTSSGVPARAASASRPRQQQPEWWLLPSPASSCLEI